MNVLVVGGAGYIGSHTAKVLHQCGHHPVVLDSLVHGHEDFVKWGEFIKADMDNRPVVDRVLREHSIDAVMLFAAFAYVGESMTEPERYYINNVARTLCLLQAMKERGVKYIVYSSTCATYGIPERIPISENHVQNPISPYGRSKLMVEKILKDYHAAYGMNYMILRYFNAAGADPENEIGEDHNPETHLIPLVLDVAIGRKPRIAVYGTDYDTPDGTCVRDYVHVMDLAGAHVLALDKLTRENESGVFNLGTERGYSVKQVIDTVASITHIPIDRALAGRRPGDPAVLVAESRKAREQLRWEPRYSDLDSMVLHAWNWHRKRFPS